MGLREAWCDHRDIHFQSEGALVYLIQLFSTLASHYITQKAFVKYQGLP